MRIKISRVTLGTQTFTSSATFTNASVANLNCLWKSSVLSLFKLVIILRKLMATGTRGWYTLCVYEKDAAKRGLIGKKIGSLGRNRTFDH